MLLTAFITWSCSLSSGFKSQFQIKNYISKFFAESNWFTEILLCKKGSWEQVVKKSILGNSIGKKPTSS